MQDMVYHNKRDFVAEILASPAYQERVNDLFELFCASRNTNSNPNSLLAIQAALAELLINWQGKQHEFKKEGNELGIAILRRLILILQQMADSMVWRILRYDRALIQLLAEHAKTGFLDNTVFTDFNKAQQIIDEDGAIVIINDLTTTLRHGDLTVVFPDKRIQIIENKLGKSSSKNVHAIRQRKYINNLLEFINTGTRISKDETKDYLIRLDIPINTHHKVAAEVINLAKEDGYHRKIINDCFAIEAVGLGHTNAHFPKERPFENIEHSLSQGNLDWDLFTKPTTRIAPYGIFPFDNKTCFDLMTGYMLVVASINFDALVESFAQQDLSLELPKMRQEEIEHFLSASMAERSELLKQNKFSWFIIRNGDKFIRLSPDNWGKVLIELFHEETIIQTYRCLFAQFDNFQIDEIGTTRLYISYINETNIWN